MASQSLYRKWRSQTFSDLVGQAEIVQTLKNALKEDKLSHAYLFTGPRGTGKTSTARLLAKTLNCTNRQNGEPCNVCEQCREITAGNSFNVIEIDAASNRGIDSIRELREKVMVRPAAGKYKIYILDEAHMLTTEAFNALLKTLEEPPEHAIFVMATTDVHKMLPTVLSRCQIFNFKRISTRQIVGHLTFVAKEEEVNLERGAAELIGRTASGGMRDALSLLDQAIAYSGHDISLAKVQSMLGVGDPRAIQKFVMHIAHLDSALGLHLIHDLAEAGADLRQINGQVAEYMRAMMLTKAGANIAEILDTTDDEIRDITQTSASFSLEELTDCARIFAQNELMQKSLGTPQLGLELALLTCIERHRNAGAASQLANTKQVAPAPVAAPPPVQQPESPRIVPFQPEPPRVIPSQIVSQPEPLRTVPPQPIEPKKVEDSQPPVIQPMVERKQEHGVANLPDWDDVPSYDDDEYEEPTPHPTALSVPSQEARQEESPAPLAESTQPMLTVAEIKEKWEHIKRRVKARKDGSMIQAVLNGYTIHAVEGTPDLPIVVMQASGKFHYDTMQKDERRTSIEWAFKIELERECQVRLLPPGQVTIPLPPPPSNDTGGRAANSGIATQPQRSAYREPAAAPTVPIAPQPRATRPQEPPDAAPATVPLTPPQNVALARMSVVRENKGSEDVTSEHNGSHAQDSVEKPRETRREVLEKKAKEDQVVREVIRMFKANIKEVEPKHQ